MKKILLFIFFLVSSFIFAKDITTVRNFNFQVEEINFTNKSLVSYDVVLELPNKFKKTIISPDLNKGEQYLYVENKKTIYLPLFNQIKIVDIDEDENLYIKAINNIINRYKNDRVFKNKYSRKENFKIKLREDIDVLLADYILFDDIILPSKLIFYNKDIKALEMKIKYISINSNINDKTFKIDKNGK